MTHENAVTEGALKITEGVFFYKRVNKILKSIFLQFNTRKRVLPPESPSSDDAEDDDGRLKEFDVDQLEHRARKFFDFETMKKRSRKFDEETAPALNAVSKVSSTGMNRVIKESSYSSIRRISRRQCCKYRNCGGIGM